MSDSNTPMHDRSVQAALDESEDAIREMLQAANETTFASADERDMSLLSSGFTYGWQKAAEAHEAVGLHRTQAFSLIRKAIQVLDAFLIDDAPLATVEQLRNDLTQYNVKSTAALTDGFYRSMTMLYGTAASAVLRKRGHLSDSDAFDLGVAVYAADRGLFYGYVVFSEDASIPCRCPAHCKAALLQKEVTEEQAEASLQTRFGIKMTAIPAFGRWFHLTIHEHLAREVGGIDAVPDLDSGGAAQISHDLIAKYSLGGGNK